jgi:dienelactone hydrolase
MRSTSLRRRILTSTVSALLGLSAAGLSLAIAPASASAQTRGNIRFVDSGTSQAYLARIYQPNLTNAPVGYLPPAVVLMHGCSGMWSNSVAPTVTCSGSTCTVGAANAQSHIEKWGRHLATQGYIALALDGFTTRSNGSQDHCGESPPYDPATEVDPYTTRADDFYIAKDFLINNYSANPDGIGELGWSHGAQAALVNAAETPRDADTACSTPAACAAREDARPTAVVVFYPGCGENLGFGYSGSDPGYWRPDVPMRWNHGEDDATTAFGPCEERVDEALATYASDIDFDHYDFVDHSFDINTVADDGAIYTFPTVKCTAAQTASTPTRCARWDADIDSLAFITAEIQGSP